MTTSASKDRFDSPSRHPYGDHHRSSLRAKPALVVSTGRDPPIIINTDVDTETDRLATLQQFSASSSSIFFHPDSYPSNLSIGNDPFPSTSSLHDQLRTPTTLQLLHPEIFDLEGKPVGVGLGMGRSGAQSPRGLESGGMDDADEGEWDASEMEGDMGGSDRAGVILG